MWGVSRCRREGVSRGTTAAPLKLHGREISAPPKRALALPYGSPAAPAFFSSFDGLFSGSTEDLAVFQLAGGSICPIKGWQSKSGFPSLRNDVEGEAFRFLMTFAAFFLELGGYWHHLGPDHDTPDGRP